MPDLHVEERAQTMSYPGGKGGDGVYQAIINQMPPHDRYFEPFVGHGSILRMKRPTPWSLVVDRDEDCVAKIQRDFLPGVAAVVDDGIRVLERFEFQPTDLVYCDPPYVLESRRQKRRI